MHTGQSSRWLHPTEVESQDDFGALAGPLGVAIWAGELLTAALPTASGLSLALLAALLVAALAVGHRLERRHLNALGRHRQRGTLHRRETWGVLSWAVLWAYLLLAVAHARAWHWLEGWSDRSLLLVLIPGLYYLCQGLRLGVRRWTILGIVLAALAALLPTIPLFRHQPHLAAGFLAGGALSLSGYSGQREFLRQR